MSPTKIFKKSLFNKKVWGGGGGACLLYYYSPRIVILFEKFIFYLNWNIAHQSYFQKLIYKNLQFRTKMRLKTFSRNWALIQPITGTIPANFLSYDTKKIKIQKSYLYEKLSL